MKSPSMLAQEINSTAEAQIAPAGLPTRSADRHSVMKMQFAFSAGEVYCTLTLNKRPTDKMDQPLEAGGQATQL